jgi:hypothetical protein
MQLLLNKHKQIALIIFIILSGACSHKVAGTKAFPPEETKEGFTKATVINYTIDGCSWLLQLEDGKKLEPVNLSDAFKKDNLKVWIQYQIKKGGVSSCMVGEIVTITKIELR